MANQPFDIDMRPSTDSPPKAATGFWGRFPRLAAAFEFLGQHFAVPAGGMPLGAEDFAEEEAAAGALSASGIEFVDRSSDRVEIVDAPAGEMRLGAAFLAARPRVRRRQRPAAS